MALTTNIKVGDYLETVNGKKLQCIAIEDGEDWSGNQIEYPVTCINLDNSQEESYTVRGIYDTRDRANGMEIKARLTLAQVLAASERDFEGFIVGRIYSSYDDETIYLCTSLTSGDTDAPVECINQHGRKIYFTLDGRYDAGYGDDYEENIGGELEPSDIPDRYSQDWCTWEIGATYRDSNGLEYVLFSLGLNQMLLNKFPNCVELKNTRTGALEFWGINGYKNFTKESSWDLKITKKVAPSKTIPQPLKPEPKYTDRELAKMKAEIAYQTAVEEAQQAKKWAMVHEDSLIYEKVLEYDKNGNRVERLKVISESIPVTKQEDNDFMSDFSEMFGALIGPVSENDTNLKFSPMGIAVKTSTGLGPTKYAIYNGKKMVSVPSQMAMNPGGMMMMFPVAPADVVIGDLLVIDGSDPYFYVKEINKDGTLVGLNPQNNKVETLEPSTNMWDMQFFTKVVSLMGNPAAGGQFDMKSMAMMSMMGGGKLDPMMTMAMMGQGGQMNPMMMMLMASQDNDKGGGDDKKGLIKMMLMSQMFQQGGGASPFGNLFGGQKPAGDK